MIEDVVDNAWDNALHFWIVQNALHGVRLARTSLPVSKAGCHAPLKDAVHKVSCRVLVHRFVGGGVVKYTVKPDLYEYSIWKSKTAKLEFKQPT